MKKALSQLVEPTSTPAEDYLSWIWTQPPLPPHRLNGIRNQVIITISFDGRESQGILI